MPKLRATVLRLLEIGHGSEVDGCQQDKEAGEEQSGCVDADTAHNESGTKGRRRMPQKCPRRYPHAPISFMEWARSTSQGAHHRQDTKRYWHDGATGSRSVSPDTALREKREAKVRQPRPFLRVLDYHQYHASR